MTALHIITLCNLVFSGYLVGVWLRMFKGRRKMKRTCELALEVIDVYTKYIRGQKVTAAEKARLNWRRIDD